MSKFDLVGFGVHISHPRRNFRNDRHAMLALGMDCNGERLEPILMEFVEVDGGMLFECTKLDGRTDITWQREKECIEKAVTALELLHSSANPVMKTNSTLHAALRNLKEHGSRYKRVKDVARAVEAIEALLQTQEDDEHRSVFLELLGLPSRLHSRPFRRTHRRKRPTAPVFSATHRIGDETLESVHRDAKPVAGVRTRCESERDPFVEALADE